MTVMPIDPNAVMGMALGGMVLLIPLLLAMRFALKPVLAVLAANRNAREELAEVEKLSLRVALLEQQVRSLTAGNNLPEPLELPAGVPDRARVHD